MSWDAPDDAPLPGGIAGVGVASYQYRFQVDGGAWSAWATTDDAGFQIAGSHSGAVVGLQVTAQDRLGHVGAVGSVTTTAYATENGVALSILADPGQPGAQSLAAAQVKILVDCFIGNAGDVPRVRPLHFGERNIVIETDVNGYCAPRNPADPQSRAAAANTSCSRSCAWRSPTRTGTTSTASRVASEGRPRPTSSR